MGCLLMALNAIYSLKTLQLNSSFQTDSLNSSWMYKKNFIFNMGTAEMTMILKALCFYL